MKIIKFTAIWCSACLVMRKRWNQIIEKYPDLIIETYDYDVDEEKAKKYNIGKILPVIIFEKKGKEIKRISGEKTVPELIKEIEEVNEN